MGGGAEEPLLMGPPPRIRCWVADRSSFSCWVSRAVSRASMRDWMAGERKKSRVRGSLRDCQPKRDAFERTHSSRLLHLHTHLESQPEASEQSPPLEAAGSSERWSESWLERRYAASRNEENRSVLASFDASRHEAKPTLIIPGKSASSPSICLEICIPM